MTIPFRLESTSLRSLFLLALLVSLVSAQASDKCTSKQNCRDCIQTKNCAWCMQESFGEKPRCFNPSTLLSTSYCQEPFTINPDMEYTTVLAQALTASGGGYVGGGTLVSGGSSYANSSYESSLSGRSQSESGGYSSMKGSSSSGSYGAGSASGSSGFSSSSGGSFSSGGKIVQIYPQRINLKLRASEFFILSVTF